jgi:hypothetical protein
LRYVNGMYIELRILDIILSTGSPESIAYEPPKFYIYNIPGPARSARAGKGTVDISSTLRLSAFKR